SIVVVLEIRLQPLGRWGKVTDFVRPAFLPLNPAQRSDPNIVRVVSKLRIGLDCHAVGVLECDLTWPVNNPRQRWTPLPPCLVRVNHPSLTNQGSPGRESKCFHQLGTTVVV